MAFPCAGVRCSTPRSCFVKPSVEAVPRQVIGFDLSPKGEKTKALPNLNDDDDAVNPRFKCSNPCLISSEAANSKSNTNTATSPRSALQQLLLRPVDPQSEPASSSPAANQKKVSNGPLPIEPDCKPLVAKQSLQRSVGLPKSTAPYDVERNISVSAAVAHGNCPIVRGIAELVGPSQIINDGRYGISSTAAVSAIKSVAGNDERSCRLGATLIHELRPARRAERSSGNEGSWNIEHELPPCSGKSKKSSWMKELVIDIDRPHFQHEKSSNVEISWKQVKRSIPEQSKIKGSIFMLGASSPAAEYTKRYPLQGAGQYSADHNMDMEFLNSCYLCNRVLSEGHDVFMYNGDKAFCSMECRYQQIVIDERKERRAPPIIRSGTSPVYQSYMTTTSAAAVATASAISTTHLPITMNRPNFMNPAAAA